MAAVSLRAATTDDLAYIVGLLETNDLPVADVPDLLENFSVFEVDGEVIGAGALVQYQDVALLRSVVIEADVRGHGYGTACCRRLVEMADADGIETLYLLTTTAEAFFDELGFVRVDRESVPMPIQESRQFTDLCPTSATVMRYTLESPSTIEE